MKAILLLLFLLTSVTFSGTLPWPTGPDGTQTSTRTLLNTYGSPNETWLNVFNPSPLGSLNFHPGIDIKEFDEDPSVLDNLVFAIEGGYIIDVPDDGLTEFSDGRSSEGVHYTVGYSTSSTEGWCYQHLYEAFWAEGEEIDPLEQLGIMYSQVSPATTHTHLMWADYEYDPFAGCAFNPLTELSFLSGFDWNWREDRYAVKLAIQHEDGIDYWATLENADDIYVEDHGNISGAVDIMFEYNLEGLGVEPGMSIPSDDHSVTPERIEWAVSRAAVSDRTEIFNRYVMSFDMENLGDQTCLSKYLLHYFRWTEPESPFSGEGDQEGVRCCISNSGSANSWVNLGLSNIEENCWQTDGFIGSEGLAGPSTINPILQETPDGEYSISVTSYAFNSMESDTYFEDGIILRNSSPALREVSIIDLETNPTEFYSASWVPISASAELVVTVNSDAPAGEELQVILVFTEEMNTSSIDAVLGPLDITNGSWSGSVVPNDTWTGEVTLPEAPTDGVYTLLVSASDTDNNHLMDPEGEGTVGPYCDCHHALSLDFAAGVEWTRSLHDNLMGSPKLADIDNDGDLDVVIQSADGWVDVLDDDGSSMSGWPVDVGWIPGTDPDVWASPAIANMSASSPTPEILAVHPNGCRGYEYTGAPISPFTWNYGGGMAKYLACSSPVVADLDNDGYNEFAVGRQNKNGVFNNVSLYIRETNGSSLMPIQWGNDESVTSTPSICDVDGNGSLEVIAVTDALAFKSGTDNYGTVYCINPLTGSEYWDTPTGMDYIPGAIATGKFLSGDAVGVVVGAKVGSDVIRVLNGATGILAYPALSINGNVSAGASIADVTGDGHIDIVVSSTEGYLYCWRGDTGDPNPGFPVNIGAFTNDGVSIGDIDSDGMLELVLAGRDGKLYVINHDGSHASGFPVTVSSVNPLSGQPALGDIDDDGKLEIVFGEDNNSVLHCYEMGENSAITYLPWPQFQHDAMNTGFFPTDIDAPAKPTNFEGEGELAGVIFTCDLTWTLSENDPDFDPVPEPPADVIAYRIYRKIHPRPVELIATVSAGVSAYTDVINSTFFFPMVAYSVTAWDGVNESEQTDWVKIPVFGLDNIAAGCPVHEIIHSDAIPVSSTHSAILNGISSPVDLEYRNGCRILTDGEYDAAYIPSGSSDCIEIDLGKVCTVRDVNVIRDDISLNSSTRYELSVNGRSFSSADTGRARYIRVYSVTGASEIEVSGSLSEETSSLIEIQRGTSGEYRIAAVEAGTPLAVSVFDLLGRKVWSSTSSTGEILWNRCSSSGNTVPAGVYLIMVESDDMETFTAKVVVR